ncbi:hypothetical protein QT994_10540 [Microcoleus sp. S13_B4]
MGFHSGLGLQSVKQAVDAASRIKSELRSRFDHPIASRIKIHLYLYLNSLFALIRLYKHAVIEI